jgi:hypothetical protein
MKHEDEKLLKVLSQEQFANAPLRDIVMHLYFQVVQAQVLEIELKAELAKTNKKLAVIEDAISSIMFLRSGFIKLTYNARTSEISIRNYYRMDFSNTVENDLLKIMFVSKTGKQRAAKWQFSEVAEKFKEKGIEQLNTPRKVYKVAHRIKTRIHDEIKVDVLYVKGKEFYWY